MKKIMMFSMTPLFEDRSMGGAQKQLKKIALYLAESGHQVTILCTRRSDAMHPFNWHPNLQVVPIYRFRQPFPEPYLTPIYHIAAAIQDTGDYLAQADVFYNHDGGLIFPYIYQDTPTIISLRSILFAETLQSGFLFQGDRLIVPSTHTARAWEHTVGRFFPDFARRIDVIHNGMDYDHYRPTPLTTLRAKLPIDPDDYDVILYPHRPEDEKGIRQTIAMTSRLVHHHGLKNIRVFVPRWIDTGLSSTVKAYYDGLLAEIDTHGIRENFIFHDWVGDDEMPQFYSMGALTVALGSYVETFGNTPYESLACGTPVIVARVGPYRDMLPEDYVNFVDYGDTDSAADMAARIIREKQRVKPAVFEWLQSEFSLSDMVEAYADIILNAQKPIPMPYNHQPTTPRTHFVGAPWCYISGQGIYHDFRAEYIQDDRLQIWMKDGVTLAEDPDIVMHWYREGYLVPDRAQVS